MRRVVLEHHGPNSGDKTVLQLMLGKKDNGQKKIRIRRVSKRNVCDHMPPLVLLISMSTQISLEMVDTGDSQGRGELESLAKALNKGTDSLAFMYYVGFYLCVYVAVCIKYQH